MHQLETAPPIQSYRPTFKPQPRRRAKPREAGPWILLGCSLLFAFVAAWALLTDFGRQSVQLASEAPEAKPIRRPPARPSQPPPVRPQPAVSPPPVFAFPEDQYWPEPPEEPTEAEPETISRHDPAEIAKATQLAYRHLAPLMPRTGGYFQNKPARFEIIELTPILQIERRNRSYRQQDGKRYTGASDGRIVVSYRRSQYKADPVLKLACMYFLREKFVGATTISNPMGSKTLREILDSQGAAPLESR